MDRAQLAERSGLDDAGITDLEQYGLLVPGETGYYGPEALTVARIAKRLAEYVSSFGGAKIEHGVVDISMHRDDLARRPLPAVVPTKLPYDLEHRTIVLADDVAFTGRTCRAAMDASVATALAAEKSITTSAPNKPEAGSAVVTTPSVPLPESSPMSRP